MMAPKLRVRRPPLEVQSQEDAAWYDGDISLEGSRLRVHFHGFSNEHDEFWEGDCLKSTSKLLEIVRLRSKQLQDSECTKVFIGMVVCANFKTPDGSESKYYDAKIISTGHADSQKPYGSILCKIQQSPHSFLKGRRELCKCQFTLAWEAGPFKQKEVILGCADISLIDFESVEKHSIAHLVLQAAREHEDLNKPEVSLSNDVGLNAAEVITSCDDEDLPDYVVQKMEDYSIFDEFMGKQADKLEEALKIYNTRMLLT